MNRIAFFIGMIAALASAPGAAQELTALEEQAFRAAVDRVAPSVVRIDTVGGLEQVNDVLLGEGPTTGLIVSADGLILSSTFNFLRLPTSILVSLPGGKRVPAKIVARDHSRKLILLEVKPDQPLPVPEVAPPSETRVGQWAIAVGRTFHVDKPNLSVGIISALNRVWSKAVQTDAKISPSNYGGPLIDLHGRVIGILAPLSPNSEHEMAGAEWYDGGIGFAVPLADVLRRLERLKAGEDLHPGLLGVSLKAGDIYSQPAEIAAAQPKSPAFQAGIRAGDTIVRVNDMPIERQAQLRHALGTLYAGEKVELELKKGDDQRVVTLELAQKIDPYEHPFLGILPARDMKAGESGVGVRYVYPESAAAQAGIQSGDRMVKVADSAIQDASSLREALARFEPLQEVEAVVMRDGSEKKFTVKLGTIPTDFPPSAATPPAEKAPPADAALTTIRIPEEPNECAAYLPQDAGEEKSLGLLVVLPQPGGFKADEFKAQWSGLAEQYNLIVLAPQSRLPQMWMPNETAFIRKAIDHCLTNYRVDRARVAVMGYQSSGAMAYLAAFRLRDVVRGVVAVEAVIPALAGRPPDNDPIERLQIVVISFAASDVKQRVQQTTKLLRDMKYPVLDQELPGEPQPISDDTRVEISRWLETLDRI